MLSLPDTDGFYKLNKSQLAKMIQSGRCFSRNLKNLGKYMSSNLAVPLAKDVLSNVATKANLSVIDKLARKISRKGAILAGRRFNLFISNEEIDDIIKIKESVEKLSLLLYGVT